jgi:serine/threonine-protein kinase
VDLAPTGVVREIFGWLLTPGEVLIDRYRVKNLLGRGGFAATYGVEDIRLSDRRCALKEVPRLLFDDGESEILSRLHHRGIPNIRDRFEERDMVYLVLEFGGSRSLNVERIERGGRIPAETVVPWIRQLCDVLRYLHEQDPPIVHRDLKPANVLLNENGQINLIDFGIAKETGTDAQTRTIARSATHGFSPPEQVLGTGTDQRSDVYALGATLYVLLTGQKPPPAHQRVAGAELTHPMALVPNLPPALDALIMRAVELNINQRMQSIAEFDDGLAAMERGGPAPAALNSAGAGASATRGGALPIEGRTLMVEGDAAAVYTPDASRAQRSRMVWWAALIGVLAVAGAAWWTTREPMAGEPIAGSKLEAEVDHTTVAIGGAATPKLAERSPSGSAETSAAESTEIGEQPVPEMSEPVELEDRAQRPTADLPWRPPDEAAAALGAQPEPPNEASNPRAPSADSSEPDWGAGFQRGNTIRTN